MSLYDTWQRRLVAVFNRSWERPRCHYWAASSGPIVGGRGVLIECGINIACLSILQNRGLKWLTVYIYDYIRLINIVYIWYWEEIFNNKTRPPFSHLSPQMQRGNSQPNLDPSPKPELSKLGQASEDHSPLVAESPSRRRRYVEFFPSLRETKKTSLHWGFLSEPEWLKTK